MAPLAEGIVAEAGGALLGAAKIMPNQGGPGAHIANGSFIVGAEARGRGVGRRLVLAALETARARGFAGMQFNAVAASNRGALRLYEDLGFATIGTIPEGFAHPREGRVGLHIMYRSLAE